MKSPEEIRRLLAASGEPPAPGPDTTRAVWARIGRTKQPAISSRRLGWLPRGWELACAVVSALALGVISAEWRLRREGDASVEHRRYLASIDPTVPPPMGPRP